MRFAQLVDLLGTSMMDEHTRWRERRALSLLLAQFIE
jgi:hypothetical protein